MFSVIRRGFLTASFEKPSHIYDTPDDDHRSEDRQGHGDGAHFMAEVRREKRGEDGLRDQEGSARAQDFVTREPSLICCRQAGQRQSRKVWGKRCPQLPQTLSMLT